MEEISQKIILEQTSIDQGSGYYIPLEKTGGRPKFVVAKEQLLNFRETGMTWAKIAKCLNISESTLYRRVQEFDIDGKFSDVSNRD